MHNIEEAKTPDVTGGMLGKIIEMMPAINTDIPIVIINAQTRGNMYKALRGEDVVCTIIEKE
jgi:isopentenyl phosphate kinase